jgi:hypothetical protein
MQPADIHQTAIILNNEAWTENKMILNEEQQQELKAQAEHCSHNSKPQWPAMTEWPYHHATTHHATQDCLGGIFNFGDINYL